MHKKELIIVEGKSAEAALNSCIGKSQQSVHALQGKLLNVNKHSRNAVLANLKCQQLIARLGCGFDETLDITNLPFSKVSIAMDPDIDGVHSSSLVLSFLALYYRPLVVAAQLFIIKPPMFRISLEKQEHEYAWSESELQEMLSASDDKDALTTTRFKGIAQLSKQECYRFIASSDSRRQFVMTVR